LWAYGFKDLDGTRLCNNWTRWLYSEQDSIDLYNTVYVIELENSDDVSYYKKTKPPFFGNYNWPFDPNTNILPAYDRWFAGADAIMRYSINSKRYWTIKNTDETGTDIGGTISFEDQNLQNKNYKTSNSNGLMPLEKWEPKVNIQTNQVILSGKKHHDWQNIDQLFFLKNDNYQPQAEQNSIFANFKYEYSTTITSTIDNMPSIHDPWYVSDTINLIQPNTFIQIPLSGTYNVFLMQGGIDVKNLNFPYYSLKAPQSDIIKLHNEDVTYNFVEWTGSHVDFKYANNNETAVLFKENNSTVQANYKGHLASDISRATGYSNGRCIAKDFSGRLHLVYEDNGKIWHTTSTSNGYAWDKDEQIPPAQYTGLSSVPSIAVTSEPTGSNIHVVWEAEVAKSNSQIIHVICYSRKSTSGWSTPIILSEGSFSTYGFWTGPDCHRPVIVGDGSGYVNVAWKAGNNIKIRNFSSGSWSSPAIIPGAYDGYPVIGKTYNGTRKTKVIWSDDGDIRYIEGDYMGNNSWNWSVSKSLTSGFNSAIYLNYNPTMDIASDGKGYVSWEAVSTSSGQRGVYFCKYDMYNNASQAWYLTKIDEKYSEHFYPSINWDEQSNRSTLTYQKTNHIYNLINNYNSSTWSKADYGAGHYPNLPTADSPVTVWTTYNSSPYLLKNYIMNSYLTKNAIAEVSEYKRFIYPTGQDSVYLNVDLQHISINGEPITFGQGLKTNPIKINGEASFDYRVVLDTVGMETGQELMSFWFVSGGKKYLLDQVKTDGNEKSGKIERRVYFAPGKTINGHVEITFGKEKPFIMNVVPAEGENSFSKQMTFANQSLFVPNQYKLRQNFPNPFNPTTQIVFDLPKAGEVTLTVYDMTGRVVATLVNGYKTAGRYDVTFDGTNLASGAYIYRLEAGRIFVETKKLLLVK